MSFAAQLSTAVGALGLLAWAASGLYLALRLRAVPLLEAALPSDSDAAAPSLSVILAARDQAAELEPTLQALLAQDHPSLQILLVDDRSSDGTGAVMDACAADDARVTALHVTDLPEGWLGKVHALQRGLQEARGELVLFTDADATFRPDALRRCAALCAAEELDHLVVMPRIERRSFGQGVMTAATLTGLVTQWQPAEREPRRYMGIGPFNLVRRDSFLRTEGFEHLRMEVLDDMGVGLLLAAVGARRRFLASREVVSFAWYGSALDMIRGLEKNLYAGLADFRLPVALGRLLALLAFLLAPCGALHPDALLHLAPLAVLALGTHVLYSVVAARRLASPLWGHLLLPVGLLLLAAALARSTLSFHLRRGIVWRGTLYPAADLRRGHRVRSDALLR